MAVSTDKKKKGAKGAVKNKKAKTKKAKKPVSKKAVAIIAAIVLIAVVFAGAAVIKNHAVHPGSTTLAPPDKDLAWGIDVSSHNGEIDWEAVSKKADFAFVRVGYRGYSEGEINTDEQYALNLSEANRYSVPVGVYFYSQAINDGEAEEEAEFLLKKIKNFNISLPVVIDFEYASKKGENAGRLWEANLSNAERTSLINAFCAKVKEAGYTPAVYASSYVYKSQIDVGKLDKGTYIWVADYNDEITYGGYYDIWQYSDSGSCAGVNSKAVDTNYWYISNRG